MRTIITLNGVQSADEQEETLLTSNLYGDAKYIHQLLRANYKWKKVRTKENLSDSFQNCA